MPGLEWSDVGVFCLLPLMLNGRPYALSILELTDTEENLEPRHRIQDWQRLFFSTESHVSAVD